MKKILPLIIILLILIAAFAVSAVYRSDKYGSVNDDAAVITENRGNASENRLIAENKQGGYKLYFGDGIATLVKDDMELKFGNWEKSIEVKTPELYYNDFDGDGAKELLISVVDNYNDDIGKTDYSTTLYLVKEEESGNEKTLRYITAGEDLWKNTFKYSVKFEITQLKTEDKYLQFAMNNAGETISYDEKTGITDNKYVSYARAMADGRGEYYTYESYSRGLGVYSISDSGEITLDIRTFIKYSELNEPVYVGNVHCTLILSGDSFGIKPNSISFQVLDGYRVEAPVSSD